MSRRLTMAGVIAALSLGLVGVVGIGDAAANDGHNAGSGGGVVHGGHNVGSGGGVVHGGHTVGGGGALVPGGHNVGSGTTAVPGAPNVSSGTPAPHGGTGQQRGPVTATGTVTCSTVSGSVKFSPPLTFNGNSNNELVKVKLLLSGCVTSGSFNVSGALNVTMKSPTGTTSMANACGSGLASNVATTATGKWKAPKGTKVAMTQLSTTGETWNTGGSQVTVTLPGSGTASNSGTSFAGNDSGASSSIALTLSLTGAGFSAVCGTGGVGHISKSSVTTGTVTLG